MKIKYTPSFIICILFSFQGLSQTTDSTKGKTFFISQEAIVKDSLGNIVPYSVWHLGVMSFEAGLRPIKDKEEYLYHYYTSQERPHIDSLLYCVPKPPPSDFFTTGQHFPKIKATDMYGNKVNTKEFKGKILVLNYWFIKCSPCREEIPLLNKIVEKYKNNKDVVFLAVCLDDAMAIADFIKATPFNYIQIDSGGYYAQENGITYFPTNVVVDQSGNVYFHSNVGSPYVPLWIKKSIEELLNKPSDITTN